MKIGVSVDTRTLTHTRTIDATTWRTLRAFLETFKFHIGFSFRRDLFNCAADLKKYSASMEVS